MLYTLIGLSMASAFVIQPVVQAAPGVITGNAVPNSHAVDVNKLYPVTEYKCLANYGYQAVFIRCYTPYGSGTVDNNCAQNVYNAYRASNCTNCPRLDLEVYMTPQPTGSKPAASQMSEMLAYLRQNNIVVRSVWIQVVSNPYESKWNDAWNYNTNFINDLIQTAMYSGVRVGIYTNYDEWTHITQNNPIHAATQTQVMLWYYDVYGPGPSGESPANFDDFRPFGIFSSPIVKQYGQNETQSQCGTTLVFNKDIYVSTSSGVYCCNTVNGPVVGVIGH